MSTFTKAMDANVTKVSGENGCAELDTTSDPRVDLFFSLVRSLPQERMEEQISNCLADSRVDAEVMAHDLILMCFQTRNCRGGKGEKELFGALFMALYQRFPETMTALLPLVPTFGCYKDLFDLAERAAGIEPLRDAVVDLCAEVLRADRMKLAHAGKENKAAQDLTLMGKWAPRESRRNKTGSALAKALAVKLYSEEAPGKERAEYRKLCSALNRALGTVEVKMCEAAWGDIDPSAVPSVCLLKQRRALLNELAKGPVPTVAQKETGNRFPEDEDRVACRQKLRACLLERFSDLKGKQLHPHEIVRKMMYGGRAGSSGLELEIFAAQWDAVRAEAKAGMEKRAAEGAEAAVNLGKLVPLVDVSGSMSGQPMEVAIALGILVSELTDPAFANRMLTFESQPRWVKLEDGASIAEKVMATRQAPWGGSTNFKAALERILEVCVANRLTPDQIPDMIVFSDMQFDLAHESFNGQTQWNTQYEQIVRRFAEIGVEVCGQPWPAPQITFWNLRGTTSGFPATADKRGVKLLSGFSPALLKLLLDGDEAEQLEEEVEMEVDGAVVVTKVKRKATPLETLRKCLDDDQYDPVRAVLSASTEGALVSYSFTPVEPTEVEEKEDPWEEVEQP